MNEFDDHTARVSKVLHDTASELDVPSVGVSAVRRHGSARQHRRRAGIATMAAVALLGAGALTVQRLSHNPSPTTGPAAVPPSIGETTPAVIDTVATTTSDGSGSEPGSFGNPVNRVDSAFVWNAVEPGSAEAVSGFPLGIGPSQQAPYLVWSTAPGPTVGGDFRPVLYRSDDGIHWSPAASDTFIEPAVTRRGIASQNGVLFAFGTAAATAAIPQGGAGDAVVDISSDGGASWQPQVLPLDLRGLAAMDGVGGVGMSGGIAAANGVVVAVAQPSVWWDAAASGELVITTAGAYKITYPQCEGSCTETTVSGREASGSAPADTDSSDTAPADTSSADTSPPNTTPAEASPNGTVLSGVDDTVPTVTGLIPFDELGIDPASVAVARTLRAFVSTNGADFTEAEFPTLPDSVIANGGDIRVFVAGNAFYVTISTSTFDPSRMTTNGGSTNATLAYRSSDGVTWEAIGDAGNMSGRELVGVMSDGTLVGRSYNLDGSSGIATSADGETWQVRDLRPLIDPSDGEIVYVDAWTVSVSDEGITIVGAMNNDPIAEAGGRSIERDGVRLEVASVRIGAPVAYDVATGDEIPQNLLTWAESGMSVISDDGGTRASFTNDEISQLQGAQDGQLTTRVLLHSDDGVNWSRENLADLTGSPEAGPGFIQTQDGKVLVTVIDPSRRTNTMATTTVLVGTRK